MRQQITDYDIQALVDNELSYEEAKRVQAAFEYDAGLKRRYEELMHQKKLLKRWFLGESH